MALGKTFLNNKEPYHSVVLRHVVLPSEFGGSVVKGEKGRTSETERKRG